MRSLFLCALTILLQVMAVFHCPFSLAQSLAERNESLLREIQEVHGLSEAQMEGIRAVFKASRVIGQGNPAVSEHPMTPTE